MGLVGQVVAARRRPERTIMIVIILLVLLAALAPGAAGAGTAFTYQGELTDLGEPVDGSADLVFQIFDTESGGAPLAAAVTVSDVAVTDGRFTVTVDFGEVFDGGDRWLEIAARTPHDPTDSEPYVTLAPRQPITPVPYALHAAVATSAGGNSLDAAYDQGGPGAGRVITADAGPVQITSAGLLVDQQLGVGTGAPETPLHVAGGTDLTPTAGGFVRIGAAGGRNIGMDDNEIMARDAGGASTLYLNHNGGDVNVDAFGSGRLGVGTQNPIKTVHVDGGLHVAGTSEDISWPPGQRLQAGTWDGSTYVPYIDVRTSSGGPELRVYGANGNTNVRLRNYSSVYQNYGWISADDAQGNYQAAMFVNPSGQGVIFADTKNFRVPNPRDPGTEIWYASLEGPEAAAYIRGTAHLAGGTAQIELPEHFQDVALAEGMTVQVSPRSAASLGLAVVEVSPAQFTVRELMGGEGDYAFDWEVMAVRAGHADYQVIRPRLAHESTAPRTAEVTDAEMRAARAARAVRAESAAHSAPDEEVGHE
jgi:hypothetical protein